MDAREHKNMEEEIPEFLEDRLSNERLDRFLVHLKECASCRDELSIQYLVKEGLPRIEAGESFSLNEDLAAYVDLENRRLNRRLRLAFVAFALEAMTLLAVFGEILFLVRYMMRLA